MNELNQVLGESRGVPLNDFVIALKRASSRVGEEALLFDETTVSVVAEELYQMSVEGPEWEVFV